jgi:hypothetical protein
MTKEPVTTPEEDPEDDIDPILNSETIESLEKNFGKGFETKKVLTGRGYTLNQLLELSKD